MGTAEDARWERLLIPGYRPRRFAFALPLHLDHAVHGGTTVVKRNEKSLHTHQRDGEKRARGGAGARPAVR